MGGRCCAENNSKDGDVVENRFGEEIGLPVLPQVRDRAESVGEMSGFENEEPPSDTDRVHQVKIGEEFTVTIPQRKGMKLGIVTCVSRFYPDFNIIEVKPDGLISAWNAENPDKVVREGDDLMEVNGVRDKKKICEFLGQAQSFQFQIRRNS
uniref:Uncharacterized protein n=1 Tax=Pyrodinium bahamense TaxID=73915 RepID=A0A7S0A0F8_9DINO